MTLDLTQTIVAVSSGLAAGRRAIVRISGPETREILQKLLVNSPTNVSTNTPHQARSWSLNTRPSDLGGADEHRSSASGSDWTELDGSHPLLSSTRAAYAATDCSILLDSHREMGDSRMRSIPVGCYFWPDHRSFTGESCAEIHLLGSPPLVEALVETVVSAGARLAERGEFTLRSFLAGKVDLTQAEAVLGVIEADSESDLEQALSQLAGNISNPVRLLRDQLLELTAHLEAGLDFVEEDIEFITADDLLQQLCGIQDQLEYLARRLTSRGTRKRSISVVLVGLPNAGKSSLFNALSGIPRAIVSPTAGTTRDAVTEQVSLGGLGVELTDTAGIEELQEDSPRAAAQSMLAARLSEADLILFCVDLSHPIDPSWLKDQKRQLAATAPTVLVGTKQDQANCWNPSQPDVTQPDVAVSVRQPSSIQELRSQILQSLASTASEFSSQGLHEMTVRSKRAFESALESLARGQELAAKGSAEELVAAELREAIYCLSSVIGEIHTEDILGQIFSRFCIGK